jgi:hypothetical protein
MWRDTLQQKRCKQNRIWRQTGRHVQGCNGNQSTYDNRHNKVPGQCRWLPLQNIEWKCQACIPHVPFRSGNHTLIPGECKFAETSGRIRAVRHPRAPARKFADSPASDLQAQDLEGKDINEGVEAAVPGVSTPSGQQPASARGAPSSDALPRGMQRIGDEDAPDAPVPSDPEAQNGEDEDTEPRMREQRKPISTGNSLPEVTRAVL